MLRRSRRRPRVYVAWVDANTGQVRVARSGDGGKTFVRSVIGKTIGALDPTARACVGSVSIGAAGNAVGVAWIASGSGAIKARVSTNGGKKWHDPCRSWARWARRTAARRRSADGASKLALAWTTPGGVFSRVWSKSWGTTRTIASFGAGATYKGGFDVEIVPSPGASSAPSGAPAGRRGAICCRRGPAWTSCGAIRATGRAGPRPRSSRAPYTPTSRSTSRPRPSGWTAGPGSWAIRVEPPGGPATRCSFGSAPECSGTRGTEAIRRASVPESLAKGSVLGSGG